MVAKKLTNNNFLFYFILGFSLIIIVACFIFLRFFWQQTNYYQDRIYPHVYLDMTNFGGKTVQELETYFREKNNQLSAIKIEVFYQDSLLATYSAQQLKLAYDIPAMSYNAFKIGRAMNKWQRLNEQISTIFHMKEHHLPTLLGYDKKIIQELVENSEQKYNQPATNARFKFEKGKVVEFRKETYGLKLNSTEFLKEFDNLIFALKVNPTDKKIMLKSSPVKPEITLDKINNYGIEEEIATGKSDYTHSLPARIHNLTLAAAKFDGILIPPGKILSFNETVGDISSSTGYQPAYIIKSGKTILGDGGGVCQVSTTLFRAALNAGLPIIERHAHAYRVSYYENDSPAGLDATVFSPSADLKIENNTPSYILIQVENNKKNNQLFFHLYGKKDGRKINISPAKIYDIVPALPDVYQEDPTLNKGIVKQIDFAASGAKAVFDYEVSLNGQILTQKKFFSNYRPWAAVYLVGTKE